MKYIKQITLIAFLWLLLTNAGDLGVLDTQLRLQMANAWWTGKEEVQITPNMNTGVQVSLEIPRLWGFVRKLQIFEFLAKSWIAWKPPYDLLKDTMCSLATHYMLSCNTLYDLLQHTI